MGREVEHVGCGLDYWHGRLSHYLFIDRRYGFLMSGSSSLRPVLSGCCTLPGTVSCQISSTLFFWPAPSLFGCGRQGETGSLENQWANMWIHMGKNNSEPWIFVGPDSGTLWLYIFLAHGEIERIFVRSLSCVAWSPTTQAVSCKIDHLPYILNKWIPKQFYVIFLWKIFY